MLFRALCALLCVLFCASGAMAFALGTPPNTPEGLRAARCSMERRDVLRLGRAALVARSFPALREARAADADSDEWTVHKGAFGDDFLKEMATTTASGLMYKDVSEGTGVPGKGGDEATIHAVGYIYETGEKWMNSFKGIPSGAMKQRVGVREGQKFMKGLSEGLVGMRKGGRRVMVVPAYLAYQYTAILSDSNNEIVPGGASMVLYVQVLDVSEGKK